LGDHSCCKSYGVLLSATKIKHRKGFHLNLKNFLMALQLADSPNIFFCCFLAKSRIVNQKIQHLGIWVVGYFLILKVHLRLGQIFQGRFTWSSSACFKPCPCSYYMQKFGTLNFCKRLSS
jgi:hypothetical protein